jgi:hypothetical protein
MEQAFGVSLSRGSIISTLDAALTAAIGAGVGAQNSTRPLQEALEAFRIVQFDATMVAVRALADEGDPLASLPDYGRGRANAVSAGSTLRKCSEQFLDAVERNLQSFGDDQTLRTSEVERQVAELDEALRKIVDDLATMGVSDAS